MQTYCWLCHELMLKTSIGIPNQDANDSKKRKKINVKLFQGRVPWATPSETKCIITSSELSISSMCSEMWRLNSSCHCHPLQCKHRRLLTCQCRLLCMNTYTVESKLHWDEKKSEKKKRSPEQEYKCGLPDLSWSDLKNYKTKEEENATN